MCVCVWVVKGEESAICKLCSIDRRKLVLAGGKGLVELVGEIFGVI